MSLSLLVLPHSAHFLRSLGWGLVLAAVWELSVGPRAASTASASRLVRVLVRGCSAGPCVGVFVACVGLVWRGVLRGVGVLCVVGCVVLCGVVGGVRALGLVRGWRGVVLRPCAGASLLMRGLSIFPWRDYIFLLTCKPLGILVCSDPA